MASLHDAVRSFARRHSLWHPRLPLLTAVSGGSDSVAMTLLLADLAAAGELTLAGLVHLNHHVREAAGGDEAFCRALADRLTLPIFVAQVDVPATAARDGHSIELAGRLARQQAFADASAALGAERVAVAHTRDDQAETILLHLVRGAGATGGRGMRPLAGSRIRPLLACSRQDLRAWLTSRGEPWREDETNLDVTNPRNRLRHVVMPELRVLNPAATVALARFADILHEEDVHLAAEAEAAAAGIIERQGTAVAVHAAGLGRLPAALGRRVARLAILALDSGRTHDLEAVDALVNACHEGSARDIPGARMERSGDFVVLVRRGEVPAPPAPFCYELPVPGRRILAEAGVVIEALGPSAREHPPDSMVHEAVKSVPSAPSVPSAASVADLSAASAAVAADELALPLVVRSRRPGDAVQVPGVGRKKLQDLFVDRKVDRAVRDQVPIVTDSTGRIAWVAGHLVSGPFRVGPFTNTVVTLRLRPL